MDQKTRRSVTTHLRLAAQALEYDQGKETVTFPCWDETCLTPPAKAIHKAAEAIRGRAKSPGDGTGVSTLELGYLVRYIGDVIAQSGAE